MVYENFLDYTEVDVPADRIQRTGDPSYHIDHRPFRNEDTYVYKDFGAAYFGDFTHTFDIRSDYLDNGCWGAVYTLQNLVDEIYGNRGVGKPAQIYVTMFRSGASIYIILGEDVNNGSYSDNFLGALANTWYYIKVVKSGTSLVCGIYSTALLRDAGDGTDGDVDNLALTLQADHTFRYAFACNTHNDGFNVSMNNDIDNLDLHEAVPTVTSGSSVIPILLEGIGLI